MSRPWDRFMVHTRVGGSRKVRRLTPAERWALLAGAWALAAESPERGALLIAEGVPVTAEDVAEHAGVTRGVASKALEKARTLGLLVTDEGGVEWVHDWEDWNPDPKPSDSPEARRERQQRSRDQRRSHAPDVTRDRGVTSRDVTPLKERKGTTATSEADASDPTNTSRTPSLPSQRQQQTVKSQRAGASDREDTQEIRGLCELLAEFLEDNGSKRPTETQIQGWRRDVRLMVEQDGRTLEQIDAAIRWSQKHEFWRGVVLSMGKVREKWEQMRLQAQRGGGSKAEGNLAVLRSLQGGAA